MVTTVVSTSAASSSSFEAYDAWNAAVAEEFFKPAIPGGGMGTTVRAFGGGFSIRGARGRFIKGTTTSQVAAPRPVYLDMEDHVVARLAEHVGALRDPKGAFADAIRPTLYLWPEHDGCLLDLHVRRLRRWQLGGRVGAPPCLAILAFFSLAAEGMRTDGRFRSNNYYARLAQSLGINPTQRSAVSKLTRDFRRDSNKLWDALNAWLRDEGGARGLPSAYSLDWRTHVGIPISQALLREEERLALRDLFVRYRLRPGQQLATSDMLRLLDDWVPTSDLTASLKRLFAQADAKARFADIACIELEAWDGSLPEESHADGATSTLLLAGSFRRLPRPQLLLDLLVRGVSKAPAGRYVLSDTAAPAAREALQEVDGALALIDPPGDAWRRIETDAPIAFPDLLLASIQLENKASGVALMRRPRRLVILERDEEFRIHVEVDRIQLARENIILAHTKIGDEVDAVLAAAAREGFRRWHAAGLRGLPQDWEAWTGVELIDIPEVAIAEGAAEDLAALIPLEWTKIALANGFALPGGGTWLRDAPPEIKLSAFVEKEVAASFAQTSALHGEPIGEERLLSFEGTASVDLAARALTDGDYRVALNEVGATGSLGRELVSASFRIRSADSPRPAINLGDAIAYAPGPRTPLGALSATRRDGTPVVTVAGAFVSPEPANVELSAASVVPRELSSGVSFDPASEHDDRVGPAVARSGELSACLNGAHHYIIESVAKGRRGLARSQCKRCGFERWFPTHLRSNSANGASRRKATPHRVARRPAPPISTHTAVIEPKRDVDMDILLSALTYSRSGNWALYERLSGQMSDDPWFAMESARLLVGLGHIDLALDSSARPYAWSVSPATICALPSGDAILCGARSPRLLDQLDIQLETLGGSVVLESNHGAPSRVRIPNRPDEDLRRLAASLSANGSEVNLCLSGARGLASLLPHLSDIREALQTFSWPAVPVERFDFASNKWHGVVAVDQPGAYKLLTRPLRYGVTQPAGGSALLAADSRTAKWLAAQNAEANLLAYDEPTQTLSCRLGAQLPGLYERVAVLCSGRPATPHKDGSVTYSDVPADVAGALWLALGAN
jgi:hypothetical protein